VQATRATTKKRVIIEYDVPEHQVTAVFDERRIRQVASILLDNAVKYTPDGGRVTVVVREIPDSAELEVADTGIGISEDQLPHIFERFHRADEARTAGGVGLGLAIARQIIDAHGGRIRVTSKLGGGSTFTATLPKPFVTQNS
jgi:two-component system, OmpR family, sensor kinase